MSQDTQLVGVKLSVILAKSKLWSLCSWRLNWHWGRVVIQPYKLSFHSFYTTDRNKYESIIVSGHWFLYWFGDDDSWSEEINFSKSYISTRLKNWCTNSWERTHNKFQFLSTDMHSAVNLQISVLLIELLHRALIN